MIQPTAGPTLNQHALAECLAQLQPGHFTKQLNKNYLTLKVQVGRSKRNNNAVSVLRKGVLFMVGDWTYRAKAEELGLSVEITEEQRFGKRLLFRKLRPEAVRSRQEFFSELALEAFRESQRRQGYYHFAFASTDIESMSISGHLVDAAWLEKFSKGFRRWA